MQVSSADHLFTPPPGTHHPERYAVSITPGGRPVPAPLRGECVVPTVALNLVPIFPAEPLWSDPGLATSPLRHGKFFSFLHDF